jgi:Salmonella virulence plasmid 65kDa B protein
MVVAAARRRGRRGHLGHRGEVRRNPVPGAGGFTINVPVSAARTNGTPVLTLGWNSGAGNGVFGLAWQLSAGPSNARLTLAYDFP